MRIALRALVYIWALPTTSLGLLLAAATLASGGRLAMVDGVLEICGGASEFYLRRIIGLIMPGGASAITFGHVVAGRNQFLLEMTRSHERVHVRQCERWGPLFIPAYLIASLAAKFAGRRGYRDNVFEVEAFSKSQDM